MATKKRSRPGLITDLRKSPAETYCGLVWCEVEYRLDGVLKIEQVSGLTKWEASSKADARINELLG
jgi:hypothetical protein